MDNTEKSKPTTEAPKKTILEIALMPIVLALLGSGATIAITTYQTQTARNVADAQRASAERIAVSDRQLKALELFSRMIVSDKESEREMAVRLLTAVDAELARQLTASIQANPSFSPKVREEARSVAEKVPRGYAFAVVGSFRTFQEAERFTERIQGSVPYPLEIYLAENNYYAVSLGGYLERQEAAQRVRFARERAIANDAYVWSSTVWGANLRK